MTSISKDKNIYTSTFINFCHFAELIFEDVELNSKNLNYLKESLPYLVSLVTTISIFRGQAFSNSNIRPTNYDIKLFSQKEEEFLKRLYRLQSTLKLQ